MLASCAKNKHGIVKNWVVYVTTPNLLLEITSSFALLVKHQARKFGVVPKVRLLSLIIFFNQHSIFCWPFLRAKACHH
ncbi:hypothetical protein QBC43DRAFT_317627 [Cladorrhinum sp. PSN259]|nr:hypothetical protein QBC43DRAFT_317627 [Cladorrhinum sp. PSN259]